MPAEAPAVDLHGQQQALLEWYRRHRRDLPWRRTSDPYAIWVSEVMLQQTRVAAVLEHYARWMARFPDVRTLASAEEPEVLAYWSGLGYYRRARFLHRGARAVVAEHDGRIPHTAAELKRLPGIGDYTAAAVASIAFGEPVAVLDGNVERVLLRLYGPGSKAELRARAARLLNPGQPSDHNQAMMELGATMCLPRAPLCLSCPVQPWCLTRGEHPTTPRKQLLARTLGYALSTRERPEGAEVLLVQRGANESLMPGMWELPRIPEGRAATRPMLTVRHAITVTNYTVHVYGIEDPGATAGAWIALRALPAVALTGLARKVLKGAEFWPEPPAGVAKERGLEKRDLSS